MYTITFCASPEEIPEMLYCAARKILLNIGMTDGDIDGELLTDDEVDEEMCLVTILADHVPSEINFEVTRCLS
jgi:hypothetical protein